MRSCGTEREEGRIEEGERGVMERGGSEGSDGGGRTEREEGGGRVGTDRRKEGEIEWRERERVKEIVDNNRVRTRR